MAFYQVAAGEISVNPKTVNVVVTCTKQKTVPIPKELRLGLVRSSTLEKRAERWISKLKSSRATTTPAETLYSGDHWQIAKSLTRVGLANGLRVQLWVCSAGYGLVAIGSQLHPYSATFSASHPDSVRMGRHRRLDASVLAEWWELLMHWKGPAPGEARSITDLVKSHPKRPLLVVASSVYLGALRTDLENALRNLHDPQLLTIVSAGTDRIGELSPHVLPCDARLQRVLGGALMSLNVRIAKRILSRPEPWPFSHSKLVKSFDRLLAKQPPKLTYDRVSMTDNEVQRFIHRRLKKNSEMRPTPMLRFLRDSGFACEQKRFRALFQKVEESGDD